MGQQSLPKKPNTFKEIKEDIQINEDVEDDDDLDVGLLSPEDFQKLNNQLDALTAVLDKLEAKNDRIHSELLNLLDSNRGIRFEMQGKTPATNRTMPML